MVDSEDETEIVRLAEDRGGGAAAAVDDGDGENHDDGEEDDQGLPSMAARSVSPDDDLADKNSGARAPDNDGEISAPLIDASVASGFRVRACSGPACASLQAQMGVNIGQAFRAVARERGAPAVDIEDCPSCILGHSGGCRATVGSCVDIRHRDSGRIRRYGNIRTENDVGKVWSCVESAIRAMMPQHPAGGS